MSMETPSDVRKRNVGIPLDPTMEEPETTEIEQLIKRIHDLESALANAAHYLEYDGMGAMVMRKKTAESARKTLAERKEQP